MAGGPQSTPILHARSGRRQATWIKMRGVEKSSRIASTMKIKTNGIELNYVVEGSGPWLVMSHSLACDLSMWDEQAEVLRRNFKVLRFDTRGHGNSDAPAGEYTLDMLAYDVHGLLQGLS